MSEQVPLLELRSVSKSYGGVRVVDGVDLSLHRGEIHALLGENGAGKSTIAKMIAGATPVDSGEIRMHGRPVQFDEPAHAVEAGVVMVYQETSLVGSMTVTQNLYLGQERPYNRLSKLNVQARKLLADQNFHLEPSMRAASLGAAQRQMVEIARAVHRNASIILFDEPTSSMTPEEKQQLFMSMDRLKRRGVGIIFITHALEEALDHADTITVLRDGVRQATGPVTEFDHAKIVELMVGRAVEFERRDPGREPGVDPVLRVEDLTLGGIVRNLSFSAYPGEIVGLAGLVGAGRTEAAKVVYGALKRRRLKGGVVKIDGTSVRFRTPRRGRAAGVVYVTEDRKDEGIFPDLSIEENVYVGQLASERRVPWFVSKRARREAAVKAIERFDVRATNVARVTAGELSGGNQQKVSLAKALQGTPKIVIFDEPTRGVDVGAIPDIHRIIRRLADDGAAVVLISSHLPEILALSDRILVVRAGSVTSEFSAAEATEEAIMFAAVH